LTCGTGFSKGDSMNRSIICQHHFIKPSQVLLLTVFHFISIDQQQQATAQGLIPATHFSIFLTIL